MILSLLLWLTSTENLIFCSFFSGLLNLRVLLFTACVKLLYAIDRMLWMTISKAGFCRNTHGNYKLLLMSYPMQKEIK